MTYRDLLDWLKDMEKNNPHNLDSTATLRVGEDEWRPVVTTSVQRGDDVLDDGHPYMVAAE